jgi:hypothetical protein
LTAVANHDPVGLVLDRLHAAGCKPKQASPGQWNARCPVQANHAHGDKNPSLSIGTGPDGKALVCCHKGCRLPDVARALDIGVHDLFPPRPRHTIGDGKRITAEYPYYDADGELIFEVLRYTPKTFRQRRPDGNGGWTWSVSDIVERPLYQLPQIRAAIARGERVWLAEGEKDAEALQWAVPSGAVGCNSGGAGKWRPEYATQLAGATRIIIVRDNDDAGLDHAKVFARELTNAGFGDVRVIAPPAPFKDAAEALGAGTALEVFGVEWTSALEQLEWLNDAPEATTDEAPEAPVDDEEDDWTTIGLTELAAAFMAGNYEPIMPTVLEVVGSMALFYPARVNSLFGESGGGKTWVALAAVAEVVRRGERVLFVDYEDNPQGIVERLVLLGLTLAEIALVDYRNPTSGIGRGIDAVDGTYGLVVVDSTGEAMAAGSVDPNSDGEVAQWFTLAKRYARLDGAPPVVVLDHVPKDKDAPSSYAIGSQRKRAALNGAAYRVDTLKEPAKGRDGKLKLTVAKDRLGNRAKGSVAAEVDVLSSSAGVRLELHPSDAQVAAESGAKFRPTVLMERVSKYLEAAPTALTQRNIERGVTGKGAGIRTALERLAEEGYVVTDKSGHRSIKPYREAVDNSPNGERVPASPARPSASRDAAEEGASPRPRDSMNGDAGRASEGVDGGGAPSSASPVDNSDDEELF